MVSAFLDSLKILSWTLIEEGVVWKKGVSFPLRTPHPSLRSPGPDHRFNGLHTPGPETSLVQNRLIILQLQGSAKSAATKETTI